MLGNTGSRIQQFLSFQKKKKIGRTASCIGSVFCLKRKKKKRSFNSTVEKLTLSLGYDETMEKNLRPGGSVEWPAASGPRAFISGLVWSIQDSQNDCWHDVDKLTQISLARVRLSLSLLSNTRGPHSNSDTKRAGCKAGPDPA